MTNLVIKIIIILEIQDHAAGQGFSPGGLLNLTRISLPLAEDTTTTEHLGWL